MCEQRAGECANVPDNPNQSSTSGRYIIPTLTSGRLGHAREVLAFVHTHAKAMSIPVRPKSRPPTLPTDAVERLQKLTREGTFNLSPKEQGWQARHRFLKDHGYLLRPRYSPGWKPSWIDTDYDSFYCEDSIVLLVSLTNVTQRHSRSELTCLGASHTHCSTTKL